MSAFAAHGYHKASVADIARLAGISKAMVFTYFGSKKGCYEYMCSEMLRVTTQRFKVLRNQLLSVGDFFERIKLAVHTKVEIFKECPSLLGFATAIFTERDSEVLDIINNVMAKGNEMRVEILTSGVELNKFKNPQDAVRLSKMAEWLSAGCADEWVRCGQQQLNALLQEFLRCMDLLRLNFYREEYI